MNLQSPCRKPLCNPALWGSHHLYIIKIFSQPADLFTVCFEERLLSRQLQRLIYFVSHCKTKYINIAVEIGYWKTMTVNTDLIYHVSILLDCLDRKDTNLKEEDLKLSNRLPNLL